MDNEINPGSDDELDVVRKAELAFCLLLEKAVRGLRFIPNSEPDGIADDNELAERFTPPYCVFAVTEPEEVLDGQNVYQADGKVVLLSDMAHTPPEQHSAWLRAIKDALDGVEQPQAFDDYQVYLNGLSVLGKWEKIEDDAGRLRCHAIPLALGISG